MYYVVFLFNTLNSLCCGSVNLDRDVAIKRKGNTKGVVIRGAKNVNRKEVPAQATERGFSSSKKVCTCVCVYLRSTLI